MQQNRIDAYVGIDLAFAKNKRLPLSVGVVNDKRRLEILPLRMTFAKRPFGQGNIAALDAAVRKKFAAEVTEWIDGLELAKGLTVQRIAIDAPSDFCRHPSGRRAAETALHANGISCFSTPCEMEFEDKINQCRKFLADGGQPSQCLETSPQAIFRTRSNSIWTASRRCNLGFQDRAVVKRCRLISDSVTPI